MQKEAKIYVAGHRGLVGSAIVRRLKSAGHTNILTKTHAELDLLRQAEVETFFRTEKPDYVFLAAARVGGIHANNTYPAEFIYQNMMMEANIIHAAYQYSAKKLLFLGSSCIYPKLAPQPLKEEYLLTGALEPTNEAYAVAKIAGIKLAEFYSKQYGAHFISAMPTNLYGPGDNYDLQNSHVLPALIRKFHEATQSGARSVEIWGSGTPRREFLHVDDLADACYFLMQNYEGIPFINIGTGKDISIAELAELVKEITGFSGELNYNTSRPDGTPRKLLDVGRLNNLGWKYKIDLKEGIEHAYQDYKAHSKK